MHLLETRVAAVTVYTDRARVTRSGRQALPAGQQELVVEQLPAGLVPESVRAKARAEAPLRILSTDVTRTFHTEPVEAERAALQARLEELQEQDQLLVKRAAGLQVRREFLRTFAASAGEQLARGVAYGRSSVETGAGIGSFLAEQLSLLDAEEVEIERERRELGKEIDAVRSRLAQCGGTARERCRVTVLLDLDAEALVEVDVSYQVPGAAWRPLYDLRLSEPEGGPRLTLTYQAEVSQRSGEEWDDVQLSLSTAKPAMSAQVPVFQPWHLHAAVSVPPPMRARTEMARLSLAAPAGAPPPQAQAAGVGVPEEAAGVFEAVEEVGTIEEAGASVTFGVSGSSWIPGDGSPHKVTLGSHDMPARLDYVTAPRSVGQAYLRARAVNSSAAVMLPGTAQVFHEEEFVGATPLKTVAPGQDLEVFLGVDDRIRVERKLVQGAVDKKLLADVRRLTYAYEIEVRNLKSRRETVTVLDQLPLPRHESVKVRKLDARPAPSQETEMGKLSWELGLDPGQASTIRFGFLIEAPRDLQLVGLPPLLDAP